MNQNEKASPKPGTIPTISLIRMLSDMRARRIFGRPRRAAWMSTSAEIIADAVSPIPGTNPIIGSRPNRNLVLGNAMSSSITSATQRKSDSRPPRLSLFSGGRTSHSRVFDSRLSTFEFTVGIGQKSRYRSNRQNGGTGLCPVHVIWDATEVVPSSLHRSNSTMLILYQCRRECSEMSRLRST